uniref:Pentatricopeptide repeat-containing protein n=1 Tax=Kalanchoe fedtschenkoi TaxID=63787 RepID=A0A7N0VJF6_KALFE
MARISSPILHSSTNRLKSSSSSLLQSPSPQKPHHTPKRPPTNSKPHLANPPADSAARQLSFSNISEAKQFFTSLVTSSKQPPPVDVKFHNSFLQSVSSIHDSISLFRHMKQVHPAFSPDHSTYHILLSTSCHDGSPSLAPVHQVLNLMVQDGCPPDKATTDIAVRSLCKVGREEDAMELLKELAVKHSPPDEYTYNFMVRHLCRSRSMTTVYNFIDEMRDLIQLKPNLVTYTILIDSVCNGKNLREATRLLSELSKDGFKPDCYVYNTIMKGWCQMNQGCEVLRVYSKMKEAGVEPDLVTFNTLIYGLSKSGRAKDARKFLDIMAEMGHFPDAVTYTSLMNGLCRENNVTGALGLLREMEGKVCSPNSCTYNTLLHGLSKARMLDKAIEFYEMMKSKDVELESAAYATFVRILCRNDRVAEAYQIMPMIMIQDVSQRTMHLILTDVVTREKPLMGLRTIRTSPFTVRTIKFDKYGAKFQNSVNLPNPVNSIPTSLTSSAAATLFFFLASCSSAAAYAALLLLLLAADKSAASELRWSERRSYKQRNYSGGLGRCVELPRGYEVREPRGGGGDVQVKKKRRRPRKYGPDGVAAAISPKPISSSAPAHPPVIDFSAPKRGKIRSPGSGIKFNKMSSEAADLLAARSEAAGVVRSRRRSAAVAAAEDQLAKKKRRVAAAEVNVVGMELTGLDRLTEF